MADLRSKGKIDYAYHVTEGLENCVKALEEVFAGKNYGKAYVPSLPLAIHRRLYADEQGCQDWSG